MCCHRCFAILCCKIFSRLIRPCRFGDFGCLVAFKGRLPKGIPSGWFLRLPPASPSSITLGALGQLGRLRYLDAIAVKFEPFWECRL